MTQPKVIDISMHNTISNWDQVNTSVDGVIIRGTWRNYVDTSASANLAEAVKRNMRIGVYHFYQPDTDWAVQADTFLKWYQATGVKTAIMLDCEDVDYTDSTGNHVQIEPPSVSVYSKWLHQWLDKVVQTTGQTPWIYTRAYFWNQWIDPKETTWGQYPLWVANYGVTKPMLPRDWTNYALWQYSPTEVVQGAGGNVDASWFNGDLPGLDTVMPRQVTTPSTTPLTDAQVLAIIQAQQIADWRKANPGK